MTATCIWQVKRGSVVLLKDAVKESCGSKSAACAHLARVAKDAGFRTAEGVCLPYGNMNVAIQVYLAWLIQAVSA